MRSGARLIITDRVRAVFNELRRLGYWKKENPLAFVRQFKIEERELSYLTLGQISTLLALGAEHNEISG